MNRHGAFQDRCRIVDISRVRVLADRRCAIVHRFYVCVGGELYHSGLSGIRPPIFQSSLADGDGHVIHCDLCQLFAHHYLPDIRYLLIGCIAIVFRRCTVFFLIGRRYHRMPLLLGFVLIATFIWLAENIGTFSHAWLYPSQMQGWAMVSVGKLGSWFMLTIMSYVMVTLINRPLEL